MTGWRDQKRGMRRDVHQAMRVPAVYLTHAAAAPQRVDVRLHTQFNVAKITGAGPGFADVQDTTPRIVFSRAEVTKPLHKAFVVVSADEIYTIGSVRPPEDDFITAEVAPLSEGQRTELWDDDWQVLLDAAL